MAADHGAASVVMACLVWFTSSAVTQVANKEALLLGVPAVCLVFSQMLFGSVVGMLQGTYLRAAGSETPSADHGQKLDPVAMTLVAGFCNALGHTCTMWATDFIPTALAHTIRATETFFVALGSVYFGTSSLALKHWLLMGVITAGIGVDSLLDALSTNVPGALFALGIGAAMSANLLLSTRTIFSKAQGQIFGERVRYLDLCYYGAFVLAAPALFTETPLALYFSAPNVTATVCHVMYSESSFYVLSRLDPVSHGMVKIASRLTIILTTAIAFHYDLSVVKAGGFAVALSGIVVYAANKPKGTIPVSSLPRGVVPFLQSRKLATGLCLGTSIVMAYIAAPIFTSLGREMWYPSHSLRGTHTTHGPGFGSEVGALPLGASWNACDDRIGQLTCLATIVVDARDSAAVPFFDELQGAVCADLVREREWVDRAHSQLCIQAGTRIGSLAEVQRGTMGISVQRYLQPVEAQAAIAHWGLQGARVVQRKTIAMHAMYIPSSPKANAEREKDGNFGNFMWMYGATRMMNPFTTMIVRDTDADADASKAYGAYSAYVIPSANPLNLENPGAMLGYLSSIRARLKLLNAPAILLGIGIQAKFKDEGQVSEGIVLPESQRPFLQDIEARTPPHSMAMSVRGKLTQQACESANVTNCNPLGCPSLTISREQDLGGLLRSRWEAVLDKVRSGAGGGLRISMVLPAISHHDDPAYAAILEPMMTIYEAHKDTTFIIQMGYDAGVLQAYLRAQNMTAIPTESFVHFNAVEAWREYLSGRDLLLSTRIHGGMAGISVGLPTLVIATDFRVSELIEAMDIPTISVSGLRDSKGRIEDIAAKADMDFAAFENGRQEKIKEYRRILGTVGLEMDPHLVDVLGDSASQARSTPTPDRGDALRPAGVGAGSVAAIPLKKAWNACGGRIGHLTCLSTIVAGDSERIPRFAELHDSFCASLVGDQQRVEYAHAQLCLQSGEEVAVLAEVDLKAASRSVHRYLLPGEAGAAMEMLRRKSGARIVPRTTAAMYDMYRPVSAAADEMRSKDDNSGNFMWHYGATRMINPFTTLLIHGAEALDQHGVLGVSSLVLATANALNLEHPGAVESFVNFLHKQVETFDVPTVVLGIGIQREFGSRAPLLLRGAQRSFMRALDNHQRPGSPATSVRGDETLIACENSGVAGCIALGCPSLTIARDPDLGQTLDLHWSAVSTKLARGETLKVALTLPAVDSQKDAYRVAVDALLSIFDAHDATFIEQATYDMPRLQEWLSKQTDRAGDLPAKVAAKTLKFDEVEVWREELDAFDLVFSTRIHGAMAGISSGVPTLVVPTDDRIMELAKVMDVPTLLLKDLKGHREDLGDMLEHVARDSAAFEEGRRRKLAEYRRILREAGLEMDPSLARVAASHRGPA